MASAVSWASMTLRSDRRKLNQDRVALDGTTFCLADGMGGPGGGHLAATAAVRAAMAVGPSDPDGMRDAFAAASAAVLSTAEVRGQDIGTTLTIVATTPSGLLVGSVGDTRAYVQPWTGSTPEQVTIDDTVAREDRIPPGDPRYPAATATLTRSLGGEVLVRAAVHVVEVPVTETTTVTMTTDGVHEILDREDLVHHPETAPDEHALYLVSRASRGGTADDATAVVIVVEP